MTDFQYTIKAHPTTYAGVNFRSRLEATWAAFFDLCGWRWTYEPFDLEGWVPDFIIHGHRPTLVEVKPIDFHNAEKGHHGRALDGLAKQYSRKIYDYDSLFPFNDTGYWPVLPWDLAVFGLEPFRDEADIHAPWGLGVCVRDESEWANGSGKVSMIRNDKTGNFDFVPAYPEKYIGRVTGVTPGTDDDNKCTRLIDDTVLSMWRNAQNTTRWSK